MIQFFSKIINGVPANPKAWRKNLEGLNGNYQVAICEVKKRSNQQSRYYWGAMLPLVRDGLKDMGYDEVKTVEDAHEICKHLFLKREITNGSETFVISGSSAELSTTGFNEYIENIQRWASTYLSVTIPNPNEPIEIWR